MIKWIFVPYAHHMTCALSIWLLSLGLINPLSLTDPVYPPNTLGGGTVVAAILIVSGEVKEVTVLRGDEPFASSSRAALQAWRFSPSIVRLRIPVVVRYRNPNLLTATPAVENLSPPPRMKEDPSLAYPIQIMESGYPVNALGQGSAVLSLEIDASGKISYMDTVKALGSLTQACSAAVRGWRFLPAHDKQGRPIASNAFAVCVYSMPLVSKVPPK